MAERYTRLYTLPENLYLPGAPLVIAAGALLKDNQTGQILAQLKMRSITTRRIGAVKLLVIGYDVSKEEVCREEHQYLDLDVTRDDSFGAKEAIPLPRRSIRSFAVQIRAVYFSDGGRYVGEERPWPPLPEQQDLNARLYDSELIRQYRMETTELSRYVPLELRDIWLCSCGEINHPGECCYRCGRELEELTRLLNVETLRETKNQRMIDAAARAAEEDEKRRLRSRKLRRSLLIAVPLLLLLAVFLGWRFFRARDFGSYDRAGELYAAGSYAEAAALYEKLGDYRDSASLAAAARAAAADVSAYEKAGKLLDNDRYDDAYSTYLALGDYRDSAELAQESLYRKGQALIEAGQTSEAQSLFLELGDYRDSAEIAGHFFERLSLEELSYYEEAKGPLTTEYDYDSQGRVISRIERFPDTEKLSDRVYAYVYDEDGGYHVTEAQVTRNYDAYGGYLGQGEHVVYTYEYGFYEDSGLMHYCDVYDAETGGFVFETVYDEHGNPMQITTTSGSVNSIRSEYRGDLLIKQETYADDGTLLERISYEYDELGRLKRRTSMTPGAASEAVTTLYSYGLFYIPDAES